MRALLCKELGPAEKLVLAQTPDPAPGAGEVLIDIAAAGINFPDTLVIQGKYQARPELPFVPGGECSGVVVALGEGVTGVAVGDRVLSMGLIGAFAEKTAVPAARLLPMPDNMDFVSGAGFVMTYGTSYYALKQRANLQPGETLLVLGAAGGVGLTAVELGKHMGAKVIAAASTEEKLDTASEAGADERINYTTESLKDRVKELTGGRGADVVYDPVGGDLAEAALRATAWNGRFLVVGFASGTIPSIPLNLALLKGIHIIGVFWGRWTEIDPKASAANFRELLDMYSKGELRPHVSNTFPLEDYAAAFACLTERRAQGKVILRVREA